METTKVILHRDFQVGPLDPRVFGGFMEHLGRVFYDGIYNPQSSLADEQGFRKDVMSSLKDLAFTLMRYPGGNFASGYHWLDGVGPRSLRPTLQEPASHSIEPNWIGTDEFMQLARRMAWEPMLTVNLGTGTPEEAAAWVEYCNRPEGTKYADLRAKNGFSQPFGVKLWCLGNEMDGHWQIGHVPADQYAIRAQQAAKLMRDTDPSIELIACGTSIFNLPHYMEWDRTVLEYIGDDADYVSMHRYAGKWQGDTADYLAVTNSIDQQIEVMDGLCRVVQARLRSRKRYYLAFDEWNVWYRTQNDESANAHGKLAQHLGEEEFNLEDALVVAGFLNSFIRHADVVKIANLAQVVNNIAPILTRGDELLRQSIYYPLKLYAARREGVSLQPVVRGPGYDSPQYGRVNYVDTSALLSQNRLHLFLINRSLSEPAVVETDLAGIQLKAVHSAEVVSGPAADARNTFETPDVVTSQVLRDVVLENGNARIQLPPLSVAAISFTINQPGGL